MLVDSHCHLDFPDFADDLDGIVGRAEAAGIGRLLTISTRVKRLPGLLALTERFANVYCSVGTHPGHVDEEDGIPAEELIELTKHPKVVALGEAASEGGITRVVIDTSPDLREQLIDANVEDIDAVFLTHEHADQTHGIDDLRSVVLHRRKRIPLYMSEATAKDIMSRFSYCFQSAPGSDYPPILDHLGIEAGDSRTIDGKGGPLTLTAFAVEHSIAATFGFRIDNTAYTPDVHDIPAASWPALENLDLWIIDGLRYAQHPSHFSLSDALSWIDRFKPKRAVITNMHADLDYEVVRQQVPDGVVPAYDGMRLVVE
jgi:phosphoribosyl 1,2-cyclic phosphate phosphodiesterase